MHPFCRLLSTLDCHNPRRHDGIDDGKINWADSRAMAKKAAGLSARRVQSVKTPGMLADGGGLYLKIAPSLSKSWIFRYQVAGRRRDLGLGSANTFGLAEARER